MKVRVKDAMLTKEGSRLLIELDTEEPPEFSAVTIIAPHGDGKEAALASFLYDEQDTKKSVKLVAKATNGKVVEHEEA